MGRIVAAEYLSLDGVTEDPGPSGEFEYRGWTGPYWNEELSEYQSELLFASDALLLGRVTWQEFVASWPLRSGDPFTDKMNSMPKFVASTTLEEPLEWNSTLLKGDVVDEVQKLKPDQNLLVYGSGALVDTLMQQNLIDVLSADALSARARQRKTVLSGRCSQDHARSQRRQDDEHRRRRAHLRTGKGRGRGIAAETGVVMLTSRPAEAAAEKSET
jgi:dihydrofolate reductase